MRIAALALALAGCTADFGVFDPVADAGVDAQPTEDAASDTQPPADAAPRDVAPEIGGDAGSCSDCLATVRSCASNCNSNFQVCWAACTSSTCRRNCQDTQQICLTRCTQACVTCTTNAGCSSSAQCADAG